MSFGRKLLSVLALVFALVAFDSGAAAQDQPPKDKPDSMRKDGMRRGPGMRGQRGGRGMRGQRGQRGQRGRRGMRGQRGGHGMHGGAGMMFRGLNLSDSQKMQVQSLLQKQHAGGTANGEEMRQLMMAKRSGLLTAAQETRIKALGEQRKAAGEQFKKSFLEILNPEQRKQIEDREAKHKQMMEMRKKGMEERKKRMEEHHKKMQEDKKTPENG